MKDKSEYMVVKMNFNKNSPKIFAKLFSYKHSFPLTINGSLSKFEDYKNGLESMIKHFGKEYISKDFKNTLELDEKSVSVEIRGSPKKVLPVVSYLSINTNIITEDEFNKLLDE